jgi:hypothetical protein
MLGLLARIRVVDDMFIACQDVPKSCAFVLLKHTASRLVGYTENRYSPRAISTIYPFLMLPCKVKFTLVQALRLCTGRTAHRGSRGIDLLYRH